MKEERVPQTWEPLLAQGSAGTSRKMDGLEFAQEEGMRRAWELPGSVQRDWHRRSLPCHCISQPMRHSYKWVGSKTHASVDPLS